MSIDWTLFFPPGTRVLALPTWRNPRLYLTTGNLSRRWEQGSIFTACRRGARCYRLLIWFGAVARLVVTRMKHSSGQPLGEFLGELLPQVASATVLVGTPGPAQSATVQLWDGRGRVIGYLRYAKTEAARERLRQERDILSVLPSGLGPRPIKFGTLGDGESLLKEALPGMLLAATLPPPGDLKEAHPWARRLRHFEVPEVDALLGSLADWNRPVTMHHRDVAPSNLLRTPKGGLLALDWEQGVMESFPYLDLTHYVLQVSALIYRQTPLGSVRYAIEYQSRNSDFGLNGTEAEALTLLAAYDAYGRSREDGHPDDARIQAWRRTIWRGAATLEENRLCVS